MGNVCFPCGNLVWAALLLLAAGAMVLAGCQQAGKPAGGPASRTGGAGGKLIIQTPAFAAGAAIPKRFTEDGEDLSPALAWSGVPDGTKELAMIVDDPDAPMPQPWVHWVIYGLAADAAGLAEGVAKSARPAVPAGACQGKNSWGTLGYRGPAPPPGSTHHYHFRLYALDAPLKLAPGAEKPAVLAATAGHVLAEGELIGTYRR
jgi:Raf kinase inhibitor-like YbhB/YbcL family protein